MKLSVLLIASVTVSHALFLRDGFAQAMAGSRIAPNSNTAAMEALTGTLEVDGRVERIIEKQWWKKTIDAINFGWFFVNGTLIGGLPLRTELRLAPGEYEFKIVGVHDWKDSMAPYEWCPRGSAVRGYGFLTFTTTISVSRSKTTFLDLSNLGTAEPTPELDKLNLKRNIGECVSNTYDSHWERDSYSSFLIFFPIRKVTDHFVKELASMLPLEWENFLKSNEWKSIERSLDQLERGARPSRPRIWADLPQNLGGPREVDASQLDWIGWWLTRRWEEKVTVMASNSVSQVAEDNSITRETALDRLEPFRAYVADRARYIEDVIRELRRAVEQAPKE